MRELDLIRILADGRFHSGEELGAQLEVSRAAIWKRLQALATLGLDVQRVRGKGYRLAEPLSLLDPERVVEAAEPGAERLQLVIRPVTGSTNEDALQFAREPLLRPVAVLAECQTAGRGRRGRAWVSPFGSSLYLSLALEFPGSAGRLEGLSLAAGVAVAEALAEIGTPGVSLKWPNDVLVDGHKLGGILIELTGDLDVACRAVIGVGLNCALPAGAAGAIDQPWTDLLRASGRRPDRNLLAGALLRNLLVMAEQFAAEGFAPFRSRWESRDALRGKMVDLHQGNAHTTGTVLGITDQGALRLQTASLVSEFHGGEVSVRIARPAPA